MGILLNISNFKVLTFRLILRLNFRRAFEFRKKNKKMTNYKQILILIASLILVTKGKFIFFS